VGAPRCSRDGSAPPDAHSLHHRPGAGVGGGAGSARRRRGGRLRRPAQRDRGRELQGRGASERVGRVRLGRPRNPGLRHRHQRQPGPGGALQDRLGHHPLPPRYLPDGLVRRSRSAQGRHGPALDRIVRAAAVPQRRRHGARGLRQLGGVGVVDGAGHRCLGHLLRQARARGRRGRLEPRGVRRAR
jgi:hypothetical protein